MLSISGTNAVPGQPAVSCRNGDSQQVGAVYSRPEQACGVCKPGVIGLPQLSCQEDVLVREHQALPLVQIVHHVHVKAACTCVC